MEPVGSAAVVLLCAEEDDLELVRWVHAARAQGLSPEVVTGIERDDAPLLESMRQTTEALFVVLRSDNLGADRMREIKSCFAIHRLPAQKLVALRLDGTAEAAIERIAKQIVGGLRSRSESSLLLAIEDVAPQIDRVLAVPPSPATRRRPSDPHGVSIAAVPGLDTASASGSHPIGRASASGTHPIARASSSASLPIARASSSASLPIARASSSASLPIARASSSASLPVVRASSSAALPVERVNDAAADGADPQSGDSASNSATHPAIAASRAARAAQDRRARAAEPRTTVYTAVSPRREKPPVLPLPALASIPAAPPPVEAIVAPPAVVVCEAAVPSLEQALALAARAHERASTGSYALDDETLPMGMVEIVDTPPRPHARPRSTKRAAIAAVLAAIATGSVAYLAIDGGAANTSTTQPAAVHERAAAHEPAALREPATAGRVSIPVPSKPSAPSPPPAAQAAELAITTPAAVPVAVPPAPAVEAAAVPPRERRARVRPRPLEELPPPPAEADAAVPTPEPAGDASVEAPPEPAPLEEPATPATPGE